MSMAIKRASYTGDPGFLDFFKDLGRAAIGSIPIVGPAISQFIPRKQPPRPTAGPGSVGIIMNGGRFAPNIRDTVPVSQGGTCTVGCTALPQVMRPGIIPAFQRAFEGGATGMMAGPAAMNGAALSGYHWNKSDYFLKSGEYVPAGSRMVRNRKRNPANAVATRHAISRIGGAKSYAKTLGRITIRKKC